MPHPPLLPWPKRLVLYSVLVVIALLAIRLIDERAMITMHKHEADARRAAMEQP
ncbi:MAG: hypothetical protein K8S99_09115 [Planctomycetes bacterium]|nr:hypothetical protein [Planctomycetota bacterium]